MTAPAPPAAPSAPTARGQAIAFGLLAALGAAVFASSFGYGILGEEGRVGPGLLPMATGLLLLLLSAGQLLTRLRHPRHRPHSRRTALSSVPSRPTDRSSGDSSGDAQRVRQLWIVVAALPVAVLLVPLLGFLPAMGLLVLFIGAVVERRPPLVALLVTAVAVAAGYGVFAEFLDVPLPTGVLGDLLGW